MNDTLRQLVVTVGDMAIPVASPLFAGAHLIITPDPNRSRHETDTVVVSEQATTLSWLVFALKKAYGPRLSGNNKFAFYPKIGELLNDAIGLGMPVREQLQYVLHHHEDLEATLVDP